MMKAHGAWGVVNSVATNRHRIGRWLVLFLAGISPLTADEPTVKSLGVWISPQGTYTAKLETAPSGTVLKIAPSKENKTIVPLTELVTIPLTGAWNPPAKGIWSGNEEQFFFLFGNPTGMGGMEVTVKRNTPSFPGDKPLPQFVVSRYLNPFEGTDAKIDEFRDLICDLYSPSTHAQFQFENGDMTAEGWRGDNEARAEMTSMVTTFGMKDGKAVNVVDYKAKWEITWQVTSDGFKLVGINEPQVTKSAKGTKETQTVALPKASPTDELRSAIRSNQINKIKELLATGANPNTTSAATAPLKIAIEKGRIEAAKLLIQAGAEVGQGEVSHALMQADPAFLDLVFDSSPKLSDEEVNWCFASLFSALRYGEVKPDRWLGVFNHFVDRLIQMKASFNGVDSETGDTILILAEKFAGNADVLNRLLKAGTDPSLKNKAGETAADIAAKLFDIPSVRLLDQNGTHAALLKEYIIPTDSPFIGPWTAGGYISTLTLKQDASGLFVSMFGGGVTWKQVGKTIEIQIHVTTNSGEKVLHAVGRMRDDGKAILIKFTGSEAKMMGSDEVPYEKGPGDPH